MFSKVSATFPKDRALIRMVQKGKERERERASSESESESFCRDGAKLAANSPTDAKTKTAVAASQSVTANCALGTLHSIPFHCTAVAIDDVEMILTFDH